MTAHSASLLATRRGKLLLLLLCAVQFLDVVDSSIMNVALPSIRRDLGFSAQDLQWVLSGYLVTYGGLLLLGGRAGDLLGRRPLLVAGTALFAACSLAGGLAVNAGMLVGARLGQGAGAAMMAPAGLSILTTSFNSGDDRNRALGVWGAVSGLAAAAGVFLGGVLSQGPGWRWVLFVNLPVCALILFGAYRLVPGGRPAARPAGFDIPGAVLATGGMLLLVYALVRAPDQGWGSARTIGELATAAVLLAAFTATELRRRDPLFPFSIFRVKGQRVLIFGIIAALALRAVFIAQGAALLSLLSFMFLLFGLLLLWTAVRLYRHRDEDPDVGDNALVFVANAFALLGLRALFFLVTGLLDRLVYLSGGLALILAFIGVKLILHWGHGLDHRVPEITTAVSLAVIAVVLAVTTVASLIKSRRDPAARAHAGAVIGTPPRATSDELPPHR